MCSADVGSFYILKKLSYSTGKNILFEVDKKIAPWMNPTHVFKGHRSLLVEATLVGSLHHSRKEKKRKEKTDMHIALAVTVTNSFSSDCNQSDTHAYSFSSDCNQSNTPQIRR